MTPRAITLTKTMSRPGAAVLGAALALALAGPPALAQVDSANKADITDDGTVNIFDFSRLAPLFGRQAGEAGYREGLDLVPDGVIDANDLRALLPFYLQPADTDPTTLKGRVFDGLGNPLPDVTVEVGTNTVTGTTDQNGFYELDVPAADLGDTVITFDGSTASDPSDGGSTEYPTIPNKPIFINGGTDIRFRDMSLPERDLNGSVDLSEGGVAVNIGGNTWLLNQEAIVNNAGVKLHVPAGCTATFPEGENPVLSLTRVEPAMLPVPMPPGLSSTIFVTYQPGGTEIDCPDNVRDGFFTKFDNDDGFEDTLIPDLINGPFLAGITNGVFTPLIGCTVSDPTITCGPIPNNPGLDVFEFAWYHVDIPRNPCLRTTVLGTVRLNDVPMTPVSGASVSVPGAAPVTTAGDGTFRIPNVPAGPNGPRCFSNPFSLRASATADGEFGISAFTPAVSGGFTDVGDIKLGIEGTVQGKLLKLSSVDPFVVTPLEGANIDVDTLPFPDCCPTTNQNGAYNVPNVPLGDYEVFADFFGFLPAPGGGEEFKTLSGSQAGRIDFDGDLDVRDFRFTGTGAVNVAVRDPAGNPVPFVDIELVAAGQDLGGGFRPPTATCHAFANFDGKATLSAGNFSCHSEEDFDLSGVPMGACEIVVTDFSNGTPVELGRAGPEDGCFINQHGEFVDVTVTTSAVSGVPGDITEVLVTSGTRDPAGAAIPIVVVDITYGALASFANVLVEFDTDQDPNTGFSEIDGLIPPPYTAPPDPFGPTELGAEWRLRCQVVRFEGAFCVLQDGDGNAVGDPSDLSAFLGENDVFVSFPQSLLGDDIGNTTNIAVLSSNNVADQVPNGGNFARVLGSPSSSQSDPTGDTFGPDRTVVVLD